MFIKGKCAIYIDKNLRVYEKSTVIFVLWTGPKAQNTNILKTHSHKQTQKHTHKQKTQQQQTQGTKEIT